MYAYAVQASLGDDIYAVEPSTRALEAHIAQLTGKEAGLFVPSGTMSNQLALRAHLKQPPYSVLVDHNSHINKFVSRSLVNFPLDRSFQPDTKLEEQHSIPVLH